MPPPVTRSLPCACGAPVVAPAGVARLSRAIALAVKAHNATPAHLAWRRRARWSLAMVLDESIPSGAELRADRDAFGSSPFSASWIDR